jgi:hypothetical protein
MAMSTMQAVSLLLFRKAIFVYHSLLQAASCDSKLLCRHSVPELLSCRLTELQASTTSLSKSAALGRTAVQQEQLAAGLAQLSTASTRRDHERAQQVAGLAARVETLEGKATAREHVVTQVRHKLRWPATSAHACTTMMPGAGSFNLKPA